MSTGLIFNKRINQNFMIRLKRNRKINKYLRKIADRKSRQTVNRLKTKANKTESSNK